MDQVSFDLMRFTWQDEAVMLARVVIAGLAGGIVGFERRYSGKRAGIRTVAIVSAGAAIFTLVSIYGFEGQDQSRLAANVASGIGFLGAGTILREGANVRGLTTAAAIWVAAALGVAAGSGLYILALGGAVLATLALSLLPHDIPGRHEDSEDSEDSTSPE